MNIIIYNVNIIKLSPDLWNFLYGSTIQVFKTNDYWYKLADTHTHIFYIYIYAYIYVGDSNISVLFMIGQSTDLKTSYCPEYPRNQGCLLLLKLNMLIQFF